MGRHVGTEVAQLGIEMSAKSVTPLKTDWEAHYQAGDTPWEKGEASTALLEALERVPVGGRVLVPGCGLGHDVRALPEKGQEGVGIDLAPWAGAPPRGFAGPAGA